MADFFRQSFPFLDIDPTMESLSQFAELNQCVMGDSALNYQSFLPFFSDYQASEISNQTLVSVPQPIFTAKTEEIHEISMKRKALDVSVTSSWNSSSSSPQVSKTGVKRRKINSGRGKKEKSNEKEVEKSKDQVVHVRARRGQATDSHSLAERVRRGKINERLRCLQDIVPGCYKTMGMAVMLDEIINYVQSLQNQVEFLSMKLMAASTYYDFNSESNAMETMQREKAQEAKELERLMRGGGGYVGVGGLACLHPSSSTTLT